jgi:hypothetical protein
VFRIGINHDVVTLPVPVARVVIVDGRDLESGAFKPESLARSPFDPKYVAGTKPEREASCRPGTIEVETRIVRACVVTNPLAIARMDMWCVRVLRLIAEVARLSLTGASGPGLNGVASGPGLTGAASGPGLRGRRGSASRCWLTSRLLRLLTNRWLTNGCWAACRNISVADGPVDGLGATLAGRRGGLPPGRGFIALLGDRHDGRNGEDRNEPGEQDESSHGSLQ